MHLLSRDLLEAPPCSRNTVFPKSNLKYKCNLPCKVRVSSSRHLNAGEGRSDVVLQLRHRGARGGEDAFPSGGNASEGKSCLAFASRSSAGAPGAGGKRVGTRGHRLQPGEVRLTFPNRHERCSVKQDFFALCALLHPLQIGSRCWHRGQILALQTKRSPEVKNISAI